MGAQKEGNLEGGEAVSDGGKGSAPRPFTVGTKTLSDNWERAFGQAQKPEDKDSPDEQAP